MKTSQKKLICCCAIIALVLVSGSITAYRMLRKPLIAFYRTPENHAAYLTSLLEKDASFTTYDNNVSLFFQMRQGRKPDLILTTSGQPLATAESLTADDISIPPALFDGITTTIQSATTRTENRNFKSLPLLSSHFEIDINVRKMRRTSVQYINTWNDIARFIRESKEKNNDYGMVFAGNDGQFMLDFLSALTEAFSGKQAYEEAIKIIRDTISEYTKKQKTLNMDEIALRLTKNADAPLFTAVQFLRKWLKEGLIYQESFNINKKTVAAFMESNDASVVVMSLSDHRNIDSHTLEPFSTIYFPSDRSADQRNFVAPIVYAVPVSKGAKTMSLIEKLISTETQEELSRLTGLAPVLRRCRIPDKQADDARYWVAGTNAPLPGLSLETTLSDSQLDSLGIALAVIIKK